MFVIAPISKPGSDGSVAPCLRWRNASPGRECLGVAQRFTAAMRSSANPPALAAAVPSSSASSSQAEPPVAPPFPSGFPFPIWSRPGHRITRASARFRDLPQDWRWSSFHHHALQEEAVVEIGRGKRPAVRRGYSRAQVSAQNPGANLGHPSQILPTIFISIPPTASPKTAAPLPADLCES